MRRTFLIISLLLGLFVANSLSVSAQNFQQPCPLKGDTNKPCDNKVDITDFVFISQNYNTSNPNADVNPDGKINIQDFVVLSQNYGKTLTPTSPTQTPASPTTQPSPGPTNTPIPTIVAPSNTPTPTTHQHSGTGGNSMAMGKWTPSKWDTCTQAEHDSYSVIGPDGKKYPTWHPPIHTRSNGTTCTFGHEHGRDPKGSLIWNQVRTHFAYDADKNGSISSTELAAAGLPFGYVNEQLDLSNPKVMMRHEDHVGHKVEYANGEPDIATDRFDNNPTAGVVVPIKTETGDPKWNQSGARCYHFAKVHQGVSSPDAFTNNIHEVFYFTDCKGPTTAYDSKAGTTVLAAFGNVGEFTNLCDGAGDRTSIVTVPNGKTPNNQNYPSGEHGSSRSIIQRSCLEQYFLVSEPKFSMNMYEAWPAGFTVQTSGGRVLMKNGNLFDVEDANRYYHPGKPNNLGYTMELCYEVESNGDRARGGACGWSTDNGRIQGITWDDPRSGFRGLHRGMYFNPPFIQNAGGPEYWYTDAFGKNASTTPFAGSVKQQMSVKNVNYSNLGELDPRINDREHDDGNGTVHAPN